MTFQSKKSDGYDPNYNLQKLFNNYLISMLINSVLSRKGLLFKSTAGAYIYLRDHNKHINPSTSILKVSYRNPNNFVQDAPTHQFAQYKLDQNVQNLLDRQIFEQYKSKVLRGIVDQQEIKQPDPLWGQEEPPVHYFTRISKIDLMSVSHPQNNDAIPMLQRHFESFFNSTLSSEVTLELIKQSDIHQLVEISLAARKQELNDGQIWFQIQRGFKRGKNLYLLSSEELVKLKWAFDHKIKQGTPDFHQILSSLLKQDLPSMKKNLLLSLFYACRYSNAGQTNLQNQIIELLRPLFKDFTFEQKVKLLLAISLCTKSLKYQKKVHHTKTSQFKNLVTTVILELDFWQLSLTNQLVAELVFSLAKLHVQNTKFITYPLRDFISENIESYCSDKQRLYQALAYLGQLEAGQGVMDQQLATRLRVVAQTKWDQFSNIQQIRIIHSLWNLGLMDEGLMELYKGVEFLTDTTLLYYACQIQLQNSSEREWQIAQCLTHFDVLPLPYYMVFKRFCNYLKATTDWNLTPLVDKLKNTQYYYSAMRQQDGLNRVKPYQRLREFEKFTGVSFVRKGAPVNNLQLCHFGFPHFKVSLDIVTKKQCIPGTDQLKESYMSKVNSLKNIGWKHLAFTQDQLKSLRLSDVIGNIQQSFEPYVEEQQAIIDYEEYQEGDRIETYKHIEEMKNWQLDDINKYMSKITGEEYIELGQDVIDEMSQGLSELDEVEQREKEEAAAAATTKKKKK